MFSYPPKQSKACSNNLFTVGRRKKFDDSFDNAEFGFAKPLSHELIHEREEEYIENIAIGHLRVVKFTVEYRHELVCTTSLHEQFCEFLMLEEVQQTARVCVIRDCDAILVTTLGLVFTL